MSKRKEVILQETLNTPQLWGEAMSKEKLYVVDVHQKWCGPCKAINGMLKRIKNELGDDYLCFAIAEADCIPSLESYRGKCEPIFLFFGCGQLVGYVHGCNAPLLQQTITDVLKHEHKVLQGEAERKVVKVIQETEDKEEKEEEESEEEGEIEVRKQITVALIKPDVVANEQVDEILAKISEAGIEVLANEEKLMSEDEAKTFYQNKADEEYFDDLISYVTSGPCRVLVLTKSGSGEGVVELWRDIIGPFDAAVAKEENPDSLRAIYGTDAKANALHGSSSQDEAARELGFFFPDFEPPTYRAQSAAPSGRSRASARSRKSARGPKQLQRTLAIIRPDALKKHKDAIMEKITEAGFQISMLKEMQLSDEQAKSFYKEHEDKEYFQALVDQMTSGPVLALCLAHTDAIQKWRDMLGPKVPAEAIEQQPDSLRAQFHIEEAPVNMLHGSDSLETAEDELKNLFNVEQTLAVIKPDAMDKKEDIMAKLKEAGFMISCQKDMNLSKEIASEIYKSKEGAEFYDELIDHMTSGPTLMMVLSAEDAVTKLRNMMGPADPEKAKESAPESLRALFAKSVMENAIHSPSSSESTKEKIKVIFGDVKFNWDAAETAGEETTEQEEKSETPAGEEESGEKADDEGKPADAEGESGLVRRDSERSRTPDKETGAENLTQTDENKNDGGQQSGTDSENGVKNASDNVQKEGSRTGSAKSRSSHKDESRPVSAKSTSSQKSESKIESVKNGEAGSRPGSAQSGASQPGSVHDRSRPGSVGSGTSQKHETGPSSVHGDNSRPGSAQKEQTQKNDSRPGSAKSGSPGSRPGSSHSNSAPVPNEATVEKDSVGEKAKDPETASQKSSS